jgi:cytoskeletal protein RodZ
MTGGIPGIGIGALFYVISALLMVVLELCRTIRGRSSLARWRVVGHQAAIAACIILLTVVALWNLHLSAWPILGTLVFLTLVICIAEAMPWVAGRPQSLPGSLRFGEGLAPRKQRAAPESTHLDIRVGNALGTGTGSGGEAADSNYRGHLMGSAALLVVTVGAVAIALILMRDNYAAVSQVREPLISQAPSQVSRVGGEENARARPQQEDKEQSADGTSYNHRPEQYDGPLDADTRGGGGPVRTEHDTGAHFLAQDSRTATATQSAPLNAQKEPAAAKSEAASTPLPAEAPAQITATGVPVTGNGRVETGNVSPGSKHSDRFDIQIRVGTDYSLRITGNPVAASYRSRATTANGPSPVRSRRCPCRPRDSKSGSTLRRSDGRRG